VASVQKLRHIYHHGSHRYPRLHRYLDIPPHLKLRVTYDDGDTYEDAPTELRADAISTPIQRLVDRNRSDIDDLLAHASWYGRPLPLPATAWTIDHIAGPNVTDKKTVLTFAKMAANAYVQTPLDGEWQDVKGGFNYTDDFGWQKDGLRGHIFADEANATVVIGLKGTPARDPPPLHAWGRLRWRLTSHQELHPPSSMVPTPRAMIN
jgi:lipase ATG15